MRITTLSTRRLREKSQPTADPGGARDDISMAMRNVHLASIDLNLLVVLDELLRSHSTVKAARQLGRTQSSVSHALGRLREIFGDPLFVRAGSGLRPTTFAEELEAPLQATLGLVEQLILQSTAIEPARLERTFTISAADFAEVIVLPRLMRRLRLDAPGVNITMQSSGNDVDRAAQAGEIDIALGTSFQPLSGLITQRLFQDHFVCVVRRDNPSFADTITLDEFVAAHHVLVSPRGQPGSFVDNILEPRGLRRRIALRTPHFTAALFAVARSDLIVTLPSTFVRGTLDLLPLRTLELPIEVPPFSFACVYNAARQKDPAHAWLRAQITAICREIRGEQAGGADL